MSWSVKCLPCKHGGQCLLPRTHINEVWTRWRVLVIQGHGKWRQVHPWGSPVTQPSLMGELPISENKVRKQLWGTHRMAFTDTFRQMLVHTHKCIYLHTHATCTHIEKITSEQARLMAANIPELFNCKYFCCELWLLPSLTLAIGFLLELSSPSRQAAANLIHSRFCLLTVCQVVVPFSMSSSFT